MMSIYKKLIMVVPNTQSDEIFPGIKVDGFKGNQGFFDRIDRYRRVLWRIPEYDLTYDLDNSTNNEQRRNVGFRGSFLSVDRT